ncbi:MAG TPA: L,D-transpeptidase, partial [Chlamydiales bacterium]
IDLGENERFLLKTYRVGVGRNDVSRASGYLTPIGKYLLGEKVAIYKPGTVGLFHNQKTEMIRVFGTRWMPFDKEIEGCSEPSKGNGLHGLPWILDAKTGAFIEDLTKLGKHESDGGICLLAKDIEEIFSIVLTKPTTVELVTDFQTAKLPGIEKVIP